MSMALEMQNFTLFLITLKGDIKNFFFSKILLFLAQRIKF